MLHKILGLILCLIALLTVVNSFFDKRPEVGIIAAIYVVGAAIYCKLNDKK